MIVPPSLTAVIWVHIKNITVYPESDSREKRNMVSTAVQLIVVQRGYKQHTGFHRLYRCIREYGKKEEAVLGLHIEGPWINLEKRARMQ